MKYLKLLFLGLLFTGCASFQISTLNHDPIYNLEVPANIQVDTLTVSQLRWKLRTDFRFRYDFAQYALSQPRSFDWNNRVLGNRYSFFNQYSFGYNTYMSRDMMWNDWVWGYNSYSPHMWSPFRYNRWGYNSYSWNNYGWNGYYGNGWGWRQQMNGYAWHNRNRSNTIRVNSRRGSNNIENRVVVNRNRSRVNVKEKKVDLIANKIRKRVNNKNIRVYNNPNNPNLNNNSKPRVYVRPNNNSNNSRQTVNTSSRSNNNRVPRGNPRKKN